MKRRIDAHLRALANSAAERLMAWAARPHPYVIASFPNGTEAVSPSALAGTIIAFSHKLSRLCPHIQVDAEWGRSRCGGAVLSIMVHQPDPVAADLPASIIGAPDDAASAGAAAASDGELLAYAREKAEAAWAQAAGGSES